MWFDCVERKRRVKASSLYNGSSRVRCRTVVPGVLACVHMYILYVCVYICVCVYVCADMYICIYMHVCMYLYIYAFKQRLYTCVCVCVCIFVHRLWVLVSVLQRVDGVMHAHVFSRARIFNPLKVYKCGVLCVCSKIDTLCVTCQNVKMWDALSRFGPEI